MTTRTSHSLAVSVLLHAVVIMLLVAVHTQVLRRLDPIVPTEIPAKLVFVPKRHVEAVAGHRAGGANAEQLPARRGAPPPKLVKAFLPPERRPDPKLALPLAMDVDLPVPVAGLVAGDPYGNLGSGSLGKGGVGGIGNGGCCRAVGDGEGPLVGRGAVGHRVLPPQLIYKVEPEFSEEARKAKFQGTVVLSVQVDASGKPSHLVVVSGPGLGLDEKAIEAVKRWVFRPAYRDGKPFVTTARVEVSFHLL